MLFAAADSESAIGRRAMCPKAWISRAVWWINGWARSPTLVRFFEFGIARSFRGRRSGSLDRGRDSTLPRLERERVASCPPPEFQRRFEESDTMKNMDGRRRVFAAGIAALLALTVPGVALGQGFHRIGRIRPFDDAPRATYPLHVSANGRYLVGRNNVPFLMMGDSPQAMTVNLS